MATQIGTLSSRFNHHPALHVVPAIIIHAGSTAGKKILTTECTEVTENKNLFLLFSKQSPALYLYKMLHNHATSFRGTAGCKYACGRKIWPAGLPAESLSCFRSIIIFSSGAASTSAKSGCATSVSSVPAVIMVPGNPWAQSL